MSIAAVILTKNEERDLPGCLESLRGVASEVFVVDSGSSDATAEIVRRSGALVLHHQFSNQASQFNWALDQIDTDAEWILRIDADERVSPDLAASLHSELPKFGPEVTGVLIARKIHFLGHPIRWGGSYPVWLLRVFRRGKGRCEDTWMDEHIVLSEGRAVRVKGDLIQEIPKSLSEWTRKHDWYADRECKDVVATWCGKGESKLHGQAGLRRAMKQRVYLKLPPFFRAFAYWFYRYFVRLGFLDGKPGLIYHFLQAFWYRFLVDAKLYERREGRPSSRK